MTSAQTTTLDVGNAKLVVDTNDLLRAWLAQQLSIDLVQGGFIASSVTSFVPELRDGEHYAGIIFGKDGAPNHHLILLPGSKSDIQWGDAVDWARSVGGELPSRREQSLLFTNLKEHFEREWYWSAEQYADDTDCAWNQYFSYGFQSNDHKSYEGRARAVRRLIIQ